MSAFADYDFLPAVKLLRQADKIMLAGHISPDGDTLGSSLALSLILQKIGKRPTVVFQDDVPEHLRFLPGAAEIIKPDMIDGQPDLLVLVDCATLDRTGDGWLDKYLPHAPLLIFDHHALRDDIPATSLIDPKLAATGELIYWLAEALDVEIDRDIARCIYTALCTDTGGFRFTNTHTHTFEIAAKLLAAGVSLEEMRIQLFESHSLVNLKMMGVAMANMQQTEDKKLVWTELNAETKKQFGAADGDTSNIAGQTMLAEGVKVGIVFDERVSAGGERQVKISFRGRNGYNVGELAAQFGGGGHFAASGCTVSGALDDIRPKVLEAALLMLQKTEAEMKAEMKTGKREKR